MKCVILVIMAGTALAASRYSPGTRLWDTKVHNINNVEMTITNYGKIGSNAGCWWPKGSGHNYMCGAGMWFGTIDSASGDTLVTIGYGPHGGEGEYAPGLQGMSPDDTLAIIYMYPDTWPAPLKYFPMAPQKHISHQDSWTCFNDCDSAYHMTGDTRPIGLEVYQTVYAWDLPILEDIIFFTYEFKNVSGHDLHDCYLGIVTDNDIGDEGGGGNDVMAGIVGQWFVIDGDSIWIDGLGYQWQVDDEPGWDSVGAIAFDLLQTPFDLQCGADKDNDGIPDQYERDSVYYWNHVPESQWDVDCDYVPDWRDASENPQLGMTAFKRFTLNLEPNKDNERYTTLAGYNFKTGAYEPFDTAPPLPDDQRFLMASGPFDVETDSSVFFVFAIMFTYWNKQYQARPDSALALIDSYAQRFCDMSWFCYTGIEEAHEGIGKPAGMRIMPNPMRNTGLVRFELSYPQDVAIRLYDASGRFVQGLHNGIGNAGSNEVRLSADGLPSGNYFVQVTAQEMNAVQRLTILR